VCPGESETTGPAFAVMVATPVAEQRGREPNGESVLAHRLGTDEKVSLVRYFQFAFQELDHTMIPDQIVEYVCHVS